MASKETAHILPDPTDPNYLYATGWYGALLRINKVTGQTQHLFERTPKYRENGSAPPIGFSPLDPKTLYLGTHYVLASRDKGMNWETVSPDLTAGSPEEPAPDVTGRSTIGRGPGPAISALAFSPKSVKQIWAATSTGQIHLTRDAGKHWTNLTPADLKQLPLRSRSVAMMEASSDPARAFAVIGTAPGSIRGAPTDGPPRIYRTDDYGQSWKIVNSGLPNSTAWAVREDLDNRNLVFAALDAGVFVSFNGGDSWQSLNLNLPAAWCRDLAIEQNDLIVATYGRALWAIDDISALRQLAAIAPQVAASDVYLFAPAPAVRMQWDTYTDTPLGPEFPAAPNPPDGAIVDYYLKVPASEIQLAVYDLRGNLVRSYSSNGAASLDYKINVPGYWLAPAPLLSKEAGMHRFVWDLRYPDPEQLLYTYYGVHVDYFEYTLADHAIPHNTPWHEPQGPMVVPGQYEIRLTVDGKTLRQPIVVKLDPRLHFSKQELQRQFELSERIVAAMSATYQSYNQVAKLRKELAVRIAALPDAGRSSEAQEAAKRVDTKAQALTDDSGPPAGFGLLNRDLTRLMIAVNQSDSPPASELTKAFMGMCQNLNAALASWRALSKDELPALNNVFARHSGLPLSVPKLIEDPACGK